MARPESNPNLLKVSVEAEPETNPYVLKVLVRQVAAWPDDNPD